MVDDIVKCKPYPTIVKLPKPSTGSYYIPSLIFLHRCGGECPADDRVRCEETATQPIMIGGVVHILPSGQNSKVSVMMVNHTRCACGCIGLERHRDDCTNDTHRYDENLCTCECRDLSHTCNKAIQVRLFPSTEM